MTTLAAKLEAWFARAKRPMPWRKNPTPYACWVSEIMLQQTTYASALPYYKRFLKAFPTVSALARASEEDVLKLWEGLGYYARARHLHKAAQRFAATRPVRWPATSADWALVPGVGPYTAAALASVLSGERVPVVDGNVARVFSRVWTLSDDFRDSAARGRLQARLQGEIEKAESPGDFNQAMMELGALVCSPRNPSCGSCPLKGDCRAHEKGVCENYPVRGERVTRPVRKKKVVLVRDAKGRVLLVRQTGGGLLKGLWDLPTVEEGESLTHDFSHFRLELSSCRTVEATVAFKDPASVPLTTTARRLLGIS